MPIPEKIFLIGFMGSGKSHWGRILSGYNRLVFYDLDERIEGQSGITIAEIFEKKGEDNFRELERYHLRKFEFEKRYLLACGGGTPCFGNNIDWMKEQGTVIYLKAYPETILKNIINEVKQRPVLTTTNPSELLFFIEK